MIHGRITAESLTAIPPAVRDALLLKPGDLLGYEIQGDEVRFRKLNPEDPFENPFATFTEWADELDSVYDDL